MFGGFLPLVMDPVVNQAAKIPYMSGMRPGGGLMFGGLLPLVMDQVVNQAAKIHYMSGMRPVVDIMFGDFLTLVMDQVVNQAAKIHYMSGGSLKAPLTIRTTLGATRRSAAQHSQ